MSPLLAQSGHDAMSDLSPLCEQERTWIVTRHPIWIDFDWCEKNGTVAVITIFPLQVRIRTNCPDQPIAPRVVAALRAPPILVDLPARQGPLDDRHPR